MVIKSENPLVYRFLSSAFAYPDKEFVPALRKNLQKLDDTQLLFEITALFEREELTKLQQEFTSLFISGYPHTICPPYESYYREGRLMGQAAVAVFLLYKEWNMMVEPALADHLATELEFWAFLNAVIITGEESAEIEKIRNKFLNDHLKKWVPQFANDLKKNTKLECYRKLAQALLFYLQ